MNDHISFEEILEKVRWHNYVCVTSPSLVAPDATTWGWGASTYNAMVSACGNNLADALCEVLTNGGRMGEWQTVVSDSPLLSCFLFNEEGQVLLTFYK